MKRLQNPSFDQWLKRVTRPKQLLIVEDDENFAEILIRAIKDYKFHCVPRLATDGQQAVELIDDPYYIPDVVILDYILPKVSGREVLQRFLKSQPETPVIIFSGGYTPEIIMEVNQLGLVAFAFKPTMANLPSLFRLFRLLGIRQLSEVEYKKEENGESTEVMI